MGWKLKGNLKGADGQTGPRGRGLFVATVPVTPGSSIPTGSITPSGIQDGDTIMDYDGKLYEVSINDPDSPAAQIGNDLGISLKGPKGDKGEKGADGAGGATVEKLSVTFPSNLVAEPDSYTQSKARKIDDMVFISINVDVVQEIKKGTAFAVIKGPSGSLNGYSPIGATYYMPAALSLTHTSNYDSDFEIAYVQILQSGELVLDRDVSPATDDSTSRRIYFNGFYATYRFE